ncbi:MAG: hypothetical protein NTV63_02200 [Candidatus Woesearchaeota archaeon]|nr:hypothetical protein [Candidatus Woesearchaeota archaeon]
MMEIGQVCMKIAGRDAGRICAVIDNVNESFVIIDGATRRKKCNVRHLEPIPKKISIVKNDTHANVAGALRSLGFEFAEFSSSKNEHPKAKPLKKRAGASRERKAEEKKEEKKEPKKEAPKKESATQPKKKAE